MFGFLFRYSLIETLREKNVAFWLIAFPFFLATIFGVVFQNIGQAETFKPIPIVVENQQYKMILKEFRYGDKPIFKIKDFKNPEKALKDEKIQGYVKGAGMLEKPEIMIYKESIGTNILYNSINGVYHSSKTIAEIMKNPDNRGQMQAIIGKIASKSVPIRNAYDLKGRSTTVTFFYSLLAMVCLGASSFGVSLMESMNVHGQHMSAIRLCIGPLKKIKLIFPKLTSYICISTVTSILIYFYMRCILDIEFGGTPIHIIVGLIAGNIMSIVIGVVLTMLIKGSADMKYSIVSTAYVASCFLAGLMNSRIPAMISNKAPLVNYINPATVVTRMFTSLYLYDDNKMFFAGILNVLLITVAAGCFVVILARRKSYDGI